MVKTSPAIKKYLRRVRRWLPGTRRLKAECLDALSAAMWEYLEQEPRPSMAKLEERFGTPKQIAVAYVDSLEPQALVAELRKRRRFVRCFAAVIAALVLLWGGFVACKVVRFYISELGHFEQYIEILE